MIYYLYTFVTTGEELEIQSHWKSIFIARSDEIAVERARTDLNNSFKEPILSEYIELYRFDGKMLHWHLGNFIFENGSYVFHEDVSESDAERYGMIGLVAKPLSNDEIEAIETVLDESTLWDNSPEPDHKAH